jgi:hypothetical protein
MALPTIQYPAGVVAGKPGTTWANTTPRVMYQLTVSFTNSCAICIQYAGAIGPWWPVPLHFNCNCRQTPIVPGARSAPFLDFIAEMKALDPAQQAIAMGRNNWRLIEKKLVKWSDVVTRSRIRPLHEVIQLSGLSERRLLTAGVPLGQIQRATRIVQTPEHAAAIKQAREAVAELKRLGVSEADVRTLVTERLAGRFGIVGLPSTGGSGPTSVRRPPGGSVLVNAFRPPSAKELDDLARAREAAAEARRIAEVQEGLATATDTTGEPTPPLTLQEKRKAAARKAVETRRAKLAKDTPPDAPPGVPPDAPKVLTPEEKRKAAARKAVATRRAKLAAVPPVESKPTAPPTIDTSKPFTHKATIAGVVEWAKARFPGISFQFPAKKHDVRIVNEVVSAMDRMERIFPGMFQDTTHVGDHAILKKTAGLGKQGTQTRASAWRFDRAGRDAISFSPNTYNADKLDTSMRASGAIGWTIAPKGYHGADTLATHESVHILDYMIRRRVGEERNVAVTDLKARERYPVSQYSKTNDAEYVAETLASAILEGNKASFNAQDMLAKFKELHAKALGLPAVHSGSGGHIWKNK